MAVNPQSTEMWKNLEGHIVSKSFNPGYVVLSYMVSYVGAWTTLELINRRTAMKGYYNWFLLACASTSMGGIAIWCMHFIGNRAVILGDDETLMQIAYSSGFTALSFFVPIIVLFLAFWAVGSNETVSIVRVVLGGTLAGLGICGMHYLGQAGISNYDCIYAITHIVGAAIIAVLASIGAIGVFFIWRSSWETSWWKRALCALVLAVAVSGMHWIASVGTKYRLRLADPALTSSISRNSTVIVVIVLSIGACLVLISFPLVAQLRKSRSADRARQVVLAAAVFDNDGRLMVTPEGLLPNRKITKSFIERSFDDVFGVNHPVFHWIFRTTRNWSSVTNLLPGMRNHVYYAGLKGHRPGTKPEVNLLTNEGDLVDNYSIIFRELFCIAASELADDLNKSLESIGVLFAEIINTGQKPRETRGLMLGGRKSQQSSVDLERGSPTLPLLGRGQLLFLVSRADRRESEHLQAAGYRFASTRNVVPILARSMQVKRAELEHHMEVMREYAGEPHILEPGVHLACFAIRASMNKGFDVLVRKDAKNQLPTMQLPFDVLESWQLDTLRDMDSFNVSACLKTFRKVFESQSTSSKERLFAQQFLITLEALKEEIADPFFNDALLICKPVHAPCRGKDEGSQPGTALLIAFRLMTPIHSRAPGQKLEFTPLKFFKMQQYVYKNSPEHAMFARKTHREFAPVLDLGSSPGNVDGRNQTNITLPGRAKIFGGGSVRHSFNRTKMAEQVDYFGNPIPRLVRKPANPSKLRFWKRKGQCLEKPRSDNSSEKNLVDGLISSELQTFGGIMISQEVSVDVRDLGSGDMPSHSPNLSKGGATEGGVTEMMQVRTGSNNGVVTRASTEDAEPETFVDELFGICVHRR